ncbi:hypothetical protein LINGRAHAP2_LOCUS8137, partial [Linum grandiflorum]
ETSTAELSLLLSLSSSILLLPPLLQPSASILHFSRRRRRRRQLAGRRLSLSRLSTKRLRWLKTENTRRSSSPAR